MVWAKPSCPSAETFSRWGPRDTSIISNGVVPRNSRSRNTDASGTSLDTRSEGAGLDTGMDGSMAGSGAGSGGTAGSGSGISGVKGAVVGSVAGAVFSTRGGGAGESSVVFGASNHEVQSDGNISK